MLKVIAWALFLGIVLGASSAADDITTFECNHNQGDTICLLENIQLTRANPQFNVTAKNPEIVFYIFIRQSVIPLLTFQFCTSFPNVEFVGIYKSLVAEVDEHILIGCSKLTNLDITDNKLEALPENLLEQSPNLLFINFMGNFIRELPPKLFATTTKFVDLTVAWNRLREVPFEALKDHKQLTALRIYANDILNVDEVKIVESFPELKTFSFNNNEISCERYGEIVEYLNKFGIETPTVTRPRQRFHVVGKVGNIECNMDVVWAAVHFKREAEQNKVEKLNQKVAKLQKKLSDEVESIKGLILELTKVGQKQ